MMVINKVKFKKNAFIIKIVIEILIQNYVIIMSKGEKNSHGEVLYSTLVLEWIALKIYLNFFYVIKHFNNPSILYHFR